MKSIIRVERVVILFFHWIWGFLFLLLIFLRSNLDWGIFGFIWGLFYSRHLSKFLLCLGVSQEIFKCLRMLRLCKLWGMLVDRSTNFGYSYRYRLRNKFSESSRWRSLSSACSRAHVWSMVSMRHTYWVTSFSSGFGATWRGGSATFRMDRWVWIGLRIFYAWIILPVQINRSKISKQTVQPKGIKKASEFRQRMLNH